MRVKWKAWSYSTLSEVRGQENEAKMSQPQVKRPRLEIMDEGLGENVVSDHELTFFYCELYDARLP